jgi:hypothetical protein
MSLLLLFPQEDPIGHQKPFWQPIGKFVFAFGYLEKDIDWCISALLQIDATRQGPSVASQIRNLSSRIALVQALFKLLTADSTQRSEMKEIVKKLKTFSTFRNALLHGPWGAYMVESKTWQKVRLNPQNFKMQTTEVTVENIESHALDIIQTGVKLLNLVQTVAKEHVERGAPSP